jgi:hypothetical protein
MSLLKGFGLIWNLPLDIFQPMRHCAEWFTLQDIHNPGPGRPRQKRIESGLKMSKFECRPAPPLSDRHCSMLSRFARSLPRGSASCYFVPFCARHVSSGPERANLLVYAMYHRPLLLLKFVISLLFIYRQGKDLFVLSALNRIVLMFVTD